METRAHALIAGVFVVALILLGVGLAWWLGSDNEASMARYEVISKDSVFGLAEHSPVSYRGVAVGTVDRIRLDPTDYKLVLIDVSVDDRVPIGTKSYGVLRLEGITGSVSLELADDGDHGAPLEANAEHPPRISLRPSILDTLTDKGEDLLTQLGGLVTDLRNLISNPQESSLADLLASAEEATSKLVELEKGLQPTIEALPHIADQGSATFDQLQMVIANANKVVLDVGDKLQGLDEIMTSLERVGEASGTAGEVLAQDTLPRLNSLLESIDGAAASLGQLVDSLERNPQSLLFGAPQQPPGPGERGYRRTPP